MIGKSLAHYEILERIGAGGMGEVFRARDTKLGREVAIKVLPAEMAGDPERQKRFKREAMAVAALKHPNIVTIYSVEEEGDTLFLTMELIEGKSLIDLIPSDGFTLSRFLELALPISDAVSYAHKQGITHRDLKPGNIMLDGEGRPKVLDFGLAKLLETPSSPEAATMAESGTITKEGKVLGTAAYMSPEQAEGKPVDARSDVFSLGIVFYEMATGDRPFQGDTSISTISSILKDHPPLVSEVNHALPRHVGRVVNRCLAKDPERRYQTGLDVRNELEGLKAESSVVDMDAVSLPAPHKRRPLWMGIGAVILLAVLVTIWRPWAEGDQPGVAVTETAPPAGETGEAPVPQRTMIVVLPFENLGPPEDAYFAAGVTEEINNKLSTVSDLGVISRTSARHYAGTDKSIQEIGRELGVHYVVEGTVRWQRDTDGSGRVRVNPRLVKVADATNVWSSQYDDELADIFEVQESIAGEIVGQLGMALALSTGGGGSDPPTENMEAYQAYLQGKELWNSQKRGPDDWEKIVDFYEQAVSLDPDFALAHAEFSITHSNMFHNYVDRTEDRLALARSAADLALKLHPSLPRGHLALGYYYYWGRQDYARALEEFAKLGDRVENDAEALAAIAYVWRRQGKYDEALTNLQKAVRLSPTDLLKMSEVGGTHQIMRQYPEAAAVYDQCTALNPEIEWLYMDRLWMEISWTGDVAEARRIADSAPAHEMPDWVTSYAWLDAIEGRFEDALVQIQRAEDITDDTYLYWPRSLYAAIFSSLTEDHTRTRVMADSARVILEEKVKEFPQDVRMRAALGQAYALLGRMDDAVREGKISVDLMPLSRDRLRGVAALNGLAVVYVLAWEDEAALDIMEKVLSMPAYVSTNDYRLDPMFQRLKGNPRYDALIKPST